MIRCSASVLAALATVLCAAPGVALSAPLDDRPEPRKYKAYCHTVIDGSRATAYCNNPYPGGDRVRLHIECERWWDLDVDSAPARIDPAGYVELTGRCWKEIRAVWVSHQPLAYP
ncbi:hypothetical protein [Streptomyces albipurpureus]|uniref:Secreted protein n=1 Tax=Streptomyces albipurpureus TaxID=2897419 RepID=A0ABT0UTJ2_9ACTN|nr:hypothetical protein [Streptomyces sp. CWNU-1]MCM2391566.1 hypothetical protein [Streptomyces sp. CWNU-1]